MSPFKSEDAISCYWRRRYWLIGCFSAMISITEAKMIDRKTKLVEPVLSHNYSYTPMYGAIPE